LWFLSALLAGEKLQPSDRGTAGESIRCAFEEGGARRARECLWNFRSMISRSRGARSMRAAADQHGVKALDAPVGPADRARDRWLEVRNDRARGADESRGAMPSPVWASTDPEASPMRAMFAIDYHPREVAARVWSLGRAFG